ncbi:unnamed protein product, partial [Heterosigma akashiwo]
WGSCAGRSPSARATTPRPGHAAHRGALPPAVQDLEGAGEPAPGAPELGGHGLPGGVRAGPALGLGRHGPTTWATCFTRRRTPTPAKYYEKAEELYNRLKDEGGGGAPAGMSPTFLEDLRFNLDIARTEEAAAAKAAGGGGGGGGVGKKTPSPRGGGGRSKSFSRASRRSTGANRSS